MTNRDSDPVPFASRSLPEHLARGVVGFGAFIVAGTLAAMIGAWWTMPIALGLVAVALVAFRGCPLCWTFGLFATFRNRAR
jgi:fatty acid desaturase